MQLDSIAVAPDESHYLLEGRALCATRVLEALKFHPPGLAAALSAAGSVNLQLCGRADYAWTFRYAGGLSRGVVPSGTPKVGEQMAVAGSETSDAMVAARFLFKLGRSYEEVVQGFKSLIISEGVVARCPSRRFAQRCNHDRVICRVVPG